MEERLSAQPHPPQLDEAGTESASQDLMQGGAGILYLFFFLSGLCALIYEIVWTRRLTLIFGITVYSISTVLVAFMGGLACGSIWFGRFIDKRKDPLRVYALLEVGIGISAVLLPYVFSWLTPAYRFLYNTTGASNYAMSLFRFLMSVGVLIVPTTLMGATLPVMSKFVVRRMDRTGARIGLLYAINTLGAVSGCFLAGFFLIGFLGMSRSEHLAASINLLVGVMAFALYRRSGYTPPTADEMQEVQDGEGERYYSASALRLVLLVFGLSGMAALAYEVLWSRVLVFLLGSSIYSFSMILAVYLLGLTAGSLVFANVADKLKRPLQVFGCLELLIGLSVLAGLLLFRQLPFVPYMLKVSTSSYLANNLFSTIVVVLPPTFLMGAIFPLAVRVYTRRLGSIGRETGTIYAVNTVGAIVGSFVAGFVLIPLLGSKNSILLVVVVSMICGILLLRLAMKEEGAPALNWLAVALVALPVAGLPFGNDLIKELSLKLLQDRSPHDWSVIAFDEDATAAVGVVEDETGTRLLTVNGISMTFRLVDTQMMAHLPLALMHDPEDILIICFGMGSTFVSARSAGMNVDFVELCPYVVDAFKYYQKDPSILDEPEVGKIVADGRNYVLLSDKTYDVITIDPPPPPYSAGTVNLYTKEFYELCKKRLKPGGIACQWIPMLSCSESQFKMLLRSFIEVFPHTTVWDSINGVGIYFVGTPERLKIDEDSFKEYFENPSIQEDLSLYSDEIVDGKQMLKLLLLEEEGARYYAETAPVMSDDLPLIEFPLFRTDPTEELIHVGLIYGVR
jgi:spermidine synthase